MSTTIHNPPPQSRSPEETEAMLDQLREMTDEQKKEFLMAHRELFAHVNPWKLIYDEVVVKTPPTV